MNASTFQGWAYDLVTLRGELRVRNRQDKAANMEITKELSGKVLKSTPEAKDVPTGRGLKQTNPKHVLTWEIELAAGEEKNLSYEYQVYVRK
jgi:predicted FMN-binding regulatory protein PaiB